MDTNGTVDASEIRLTTWDGAKTLVNNLINYQPQLVRRISSINSSVEGRCSLVFLQGLGAWSKSVTQRSRYSWLYDKRHYGRFSLAEIDRNYEDLIHKVDFPIFLGKKWLSLGVNTLLGLWIYHQICLQETCVTVQGLIVFLIDQYCGWFMDDLRISPSLKLTYPPENWPKPKRKVVSQLFIFMGYVSFIRLIFCLGMSVCFPGNPESDTGSREVVESLEHMEHDSLSFGFWPMFRSNVRSRECLDFPQICAELITFHVVLELLPSLP